MSIMKRLLLILILLLPQLLAAQSATGVPCRALTGLPRRLPTGYRPIRPAARTGREYAIRTVDRDSLGLDTLRRLDAMAAT